VEKSNQCKHIYIVPYVANESAAHNGVYYRPCQTDQLN